MPSSWSATAESHPKTPIAAVIDRRKRRLVGQSLIHGRHLMVENLAMQARSSWLRLISGKESDRYPKTMTTNVIIAVATKDTMTCELDQQGTNAST